MTLKLYAHPFSSYSQKVLIALYENAVPFEFMLLGPENPKIYADFAMRWPIRRFPLLLDGVRAVMEASVIIEYLQIHCPGPVRLLPDEPAAALDVRLLDRFFDNYIQGPQQKIVFDALRSDQDRDAYGVAEARENFEIAYTWLDQHMADREWSAGDAFSLADCAAAPALFYADWTHAINPKFANVHAYRRRLLTRPSFARAVDEARRYRPLFPLGAPDRD